MLVALRMPPIPTPIHDANPVSGWRDFVASAQATPVILPCVRAAFPNNSLRPIMFDVAICVAALSGSVSPNPIDGGKVCSTLS